MTDERNATASTSTWRLGLVASVSTVLVSQLLVLNRFLPIQEGWFAAYAHLIWAGKVPYRDFYLFLQPVYPLMVTALVRVAGYGFLAVHVLGLGERLALTAVLYVLLARLFRPLTSFLATLTAVILFASNSNDVIDSYLQVCLVFSLGGVYLLIRCLEARKVSGAVGWAAAAGAALALGFFTKQTTGLAVAGASISIACLALYRTRRNRLLPVAGALLGGWAAVMLPLLGWLAAERALGAYVEQVYGGAAASKGSLLVVLTGAFGGDAFREGVRSFAVLAAAVAAWVVAARWVGVCEDGAQRRARLRVSVLAAAAFGLAAWWWVLAPRYRAPVVDLLGVCAAVSVAGWWLRRAQPVLWDRLIIWLRGPRGLVISWAVLMLLLWWAASAAEDLWMRSLSLHFLDLKVVAVYWTFFAAIGLTVYWMWRALVREETGRPLIFALLAASGAAVVYLIIKLTFWSTFELGLAPLVIGVYFFGSVQLFFIGISGEYIGSIHTQVYHRPLVIEKERINFD